MDGDVKGTGAHGLAQQFQPWTDPTSNECAPVVLIGAGLSAGLVPLAGALARDIAARKPAIEAAAGVSSSIIPVDPNSLYEWADECLQQLITQGKSEPESKRLLADSIGLTFDPQFLAQANVPLRGTTARHRVLSRLAREGRVAALWSFNWDCWLEASLECVGLRRGERAGKLIAPTDWKLRYHVWVAGPDPEKSDTIPVFKAHGCVQALHDNRGDFVIAKSEMERPLKDQPPARCARMDREVSARWAVALGWSGTEGYVQELLAKQGAAGLLGSRLTIVDADPFQVNHQKLCDSYKIDIGVAGVKVHFDTPGTTDDLFMWIQTRRGLAAIAEACAGNPGLEVLVRKVHDSVPEFDSGSLSTFWCINLLDCWLPIWLRTCFMVGAQKHSTAPGHELEILPAEQRDAHVPWACSPYTRNDLQAAATLIGALHPGGCDLKWGFDTFPGALWDSSDQLLVLPVPIWVCADNISTIGLKPLIESVHWADRGRIRSLKVMPVDCPALPAVDEPTRSERILRWKEAIASLFGHAHLAVHDNIETMELGALNRASAAGGTA